MNHRFSISFRSRVLKIAAATMLLPAVLFVQTASAQSSSSDRWLHVRVTSSDSGGETVRVNVPLELAERVLPAINKDRLHDGKVKIDSRDCDGVDIHALLDAVRTTKDGEFVTVQSDDNDVRVAKQGGYLLIHVRDASGKHFHMDRERGDKESANKRGAEKGKTARNNESQVEVKVPMQVVDALFSAGKDELNLVAALRALSAHGDTELVSVKDSENTVRVWLDSKNVTD